VRSRAGAQSTLGGGALTGVIAANFVVIEWTALLGRAGVAYQRDSRGSERGANCVTGTCRYLFETARIGLVFSRSRVCACVRVCARACVRVQGLPASIAVLCCNNVCPPSWSGCREVQVLPTTPAAPSIEYPVSRLVVRRVRFFCARARAHGCTPTSAHWWAGDGCLWASVSISCGRSRGFACAVCRCFSGHRHWRSRRLALARSEQA
jgi:hypothetical protein